MLPMQLEHEIRCAFGVQDIDSKLKYAGELKRFTYT
jgi:hypothetical protein